MDLNESTSGSRPERRLGGSARSGASEEVSPTSAPHQQQGGGASRMPPQPMRPMAQRSVSRWSSMKGLFGLSAAPVYRSVPTRQKTMPHLGGNAKKIASTKRPSKSTGGGVFATLLRAVSAPFRRPPAPTASMSCAESRVAWHSSHDSEDGSSEDGGDTDDSDTLSIFSLSSASFNEALGDDDVLGGEREAPIIFGRSAFADLEEDDSGRMERQPASARWSRPASASVSRDELFGAAEVGALRATIALLESESESLKSKLSAADARVRDLELLSGAYQCVVRRKDDELEAKRAELDEKDIKLEEKDTALDNMHAELQEKDIALQQLGAHRRVLVRAHLKDQEKLNASEACVHDLRVLGGVLVRTVGAYQRHGAAKDADMKSKDAVIEAQGAEITQLRNHRRALVHAYMKNQSELEAANKRVHTLEVLDGVMVKAVGNHQRREKEKDDEILRLKQELVQTRADADRAATVAASEVRHLTEQVAAKGSELDEAKSMVSALADQLARQSDELGATNSVVDQLTDQLTAVSGELVLTQSAHAVAIGNLARQKSETHEVRCKLEAMGLELASQRREVARTGRWLEASTLRGQSLAVVLSESRMDLMGAECEKREMEQRMSAAHVEVAKAKEEAEMLRDQISYLRERFVNRNSSCALEPSHFSHWCDDLITQTRRMSAGLARTRDGLDSLIVGARPTRNPRALLPAVPATPRVGSVGDFGMSGGSVCGDSSVGGSAATASAMQASEATAATASAAQASAVRVGKTELGPSLSAPPEPVASRTSGESSIGRVRPLCTDGMTSGADTPETHCQVHAGASGAMSAAKLLKVAADPAPTPLRAGGLSSLEVGTSACSPPAPSESGDRVGSSGDRGRPPLTSSTIADAGTSVDRCQVSVGASGAMTPTEATALLGVAAVTAPSSTTVTGGNSRGEPNDEVMQLGNCVHTSLPPAPHTSSSIADAGTSSDRCQVVASASGLGTQERALELAGETFPPDVASVAPCSPTSLSGVNSSEKSNDEVRQSGSCDHTPSSPSHSRSHAPPPLDSHTSGRSSARNRPQRNSSMRRTARPMESDPRRTSARSGQPQRPQRLTHTGRPTDSFSRRMTLGGRSTDGPLISASMMWSHQHSSPTLILDTTARFGGGDVGAPRRVTATTSRKLNRKANDHSKGNSRRASKYAPRLREGKRCARLSHR